MTGHEKQVSPATPMPKGYKFLPKGNPYLTSLCRRMTLAEGELLYVVTERSKTLGLRAPSWIISKVFKEESLTREKRKEAVATRDGAIEKAFEDAAREHFPNMPAAEMEVIIKRALKKRSGRVGRTGTLSIESKVRLAVAAHVRHVHTDYDKLIRQKGGREEARKTVQPAVMQLLQQWRGNSRKAKKLARQKGKKGALKSIQTVQKPLRDVQSGPRSQNKKQKKGNRSAAPVAVSGRTLRSGKASTAEDPILISSDSEEMVQDGEGGSLDDDDDDDLDTLSDLLSSEDLMDNNNCSPDFHEDSVIELD